MESKEALEAAASQITDERFAEIRALCNRASAEHLATCKDLFADLLSGPSPLDNLPEVERNAYLARLELAAIAKGTDMGGWVTY